MTDQEFLAEWLRLLDAPDDFEDLEPWRDARARMRSLLPELDARLRVADEAELAKLEARAAQLKAQLGKPLMAVPTPSRTPTPLDETDAGQGIGGQAEDISAQSFRDELAALGEHTAEKRRRRHA